MKSGCPENDYRNSFDIAGLAPLIAYAVELALKYQPTKADIEAVVEGFALLYAEKSVQLFFEKNAGWLQRALTTGLATAMA